MPIFYSHTCDFIPPSLSESYYCDCF